MASCGHEEQRVQPMLPVRVEEGAELVGGPRGHLDVLALGLHDVVGDVAGDEPGPDGVLQRRVQYRCVCSNEVSLSTLDASRPALGAPAALAERR